MGRLVLTVLGVILAIWLIFMTIGWITAMVKTFLMVGLIAVAVVLVVSWLAKGRRRA
jgi:hypothetical protein